jgi:tRNA U38,U39,U40 pseudouridine synthase TruA
MPSKDLNNTFDKRNPKAKANGLFLSKVYYERVLQRAQEQKLQCFNFLRPFLFRMN